VHDLGVLVSADHVQDRVGLADVGQELVAEPLALMGAAHEAGDVVELDHLVDDGRGPDGLGHAAEPLVGHADHGHVRLEGGERIVGRRRTRAREGVEERRLARVRKADDADLHSRRSRARPSRAPATTSDG
jgi:hypothetical protein